METLPIADGKRLNAAREFLAGARRRKVAELPPSALVREDVELRRQLGQLLAFVDEALFLDAGQLEVLGQALADAIEYRTPDADCAGCDDHPAGLCDDHAADLDLTDAFLSLGREAGIEVDR
jgi:hypothetical protein